MSSNSIPAPLPEAAGSVSLGYGIAIAVGILVLVSTIMLASYVCVRVKGGPRREHPQAAGHSSSAALPGPDVSVVVITGGLDRPTIDSYPKFLFSGAGGRSEATCPICLSDYRPSDALRLIPDCRHCFHVACIDEWLRVSATCPLCRTSPSPTPLTTPLSELIPLAAHAR
ncbi:hypothetical protein AAC387_Pa02g4568 [Persea americana]